MDEQEEGAKTDLHPQWTKVTLLCQALLKELRTGFRIDDPVSGEYRAMDVYKISRLRMNVWEESLPGSAVALRQRLTTKQWPRLSPTEAHWVCARLEWAEKIARRCANAGPSREGILAPGFEEGNQVANAVAWLAIEFYEWSPALPLHWHEEPWYDLY